LFGRFDNFCDRQGLNFTYYTVDVSVVSNVNYHPRKLVTPIMVTQDLDGGVIHMYPKQHEIYTGASTGVGPVSGVTGLGQFASPAARDVHSAYVFLGYLDVSRIVGYSI
jgi:hypothetical protein